MARTSKQYQAAIEKGLATYKKGSRVLVELFVEGAERYYEEDSQSPDNLAFFLNAIKEFPVLRRAAAETLRTFGKFKIDLDVEPVTVVNNGKIKPEQKVKFIAKIAEYKAANHNSLLAAHNSKIMKAFDLEKRLSGGFTNSATSLIVEAMANAEIKGEAFDREALIGRMTAIINGLATADLTEKVTEKKADITANQIDPAKLAEAVANTEAPADQAAGE